MTPRATTSLWRRLFIGSLGAVVLVPLLILVWQLSDDPGKHQQGSSSPYPTAQKLRGEYLAKAGNCAACHTTRGGLPYAGGRAIATPFGDIYASNITPDKATGIGHWTADDFWRALHNGKSKDGRFLYPAFPYPNYTKITREDSDALYAYLRTIPDVEQRNQEPALRFPFDQRFLLAFWRALYFRPGEFTPHNRQSAEWNRGAYLVQGLGHCSACHTSRTALGGSVSDRELAGGLIPMLNWQASSLTSDAETGLGGWQQTDIEDLLRTGVSARGAVYGPMAEVVGASLQHLTREDIRGIATYLKAMPPSPEKVIPHRPDDNEEVVAFIKRGATLYEHHCANCHRADGKGYPPAYPALAGKVALSAHKATNAIRIVLNGGYPPSTAGNPRPYGMPPFAATLSDEEIAAVISYLRYSWGNQGSPVSANEVGRLRGTPF